MDLPPPIPPEIARKLLDAKFPPPAPLLPRTLAFIADGLLAGLLACLVVHLLIPVFIPDDFPVFKETMQKTPQGDLCRLGDKVFLAPAIPLPPRGVFAAGVCVGTLLKGRLEPHHQFYAAYGMDFKRVLPLTNTDTRVGKYLSGEEIDAPELLDTKNGYAAVLYEGAPLGGGKHVAGRLKNHYPKGLRNK